MKVLVFDTESDGLAYEATKVHVMSWTWDGKTYESTSDYNKMMEVLNEADLCVCHAAVTHDMPLLNRLLEATLKYTQFADSLALSWYLCPKRPKHGLESWGADFGIPKPKIDDWQNLTYEDYRHRCEYDCRINWNLWVHLRGKLERIYNGDAWLRLVKYLSFKMDCVREQEGVRWKLDVPKATEHYEELCRQFDDKYVQLSAAMPKVPKYKSMDYPKKMVKADGTLTAVGERWMALLREQRLPTTHKETVRFISEWEDGNPNSVPQIKDWLFSLGWKPKTFKWDKKSDGSDNIIPQVRYPKNHPEEGQLCASVIKLKDKEPKIEILEGFTVINHRKAFFKALLDAEEGGYVSAGVDGLTNTLRFKHKKPLANIPGVDKPWGAEIRGCLIAPDENHTLCGADMASLESTTKRHYMQKYDPAYVKEMSTPGFDEHLDLAKHAGVITQEDIDFYSSAGDNTKQSDEYRAIAKIRKIYKPVNYSAIYGIREKKLSRDLDIPKAEARGLLDAYWKRNWAIRRVSSEQYTKTVDGVTWLQNPVSGYYHELRYEKDTFSTLNQSTGVYCFDIWTKFLREGGVKLCGQFHDEHIAPLKRGEEEAQIKKYREALDKANQLLKLSVPLDIDVKFGDTYADIH